jgi:hypothetical protein
MSMPSPQTVGSVGIGLDIGGVIGQTLGTYRKGQADQTAYEYQSKIADRNAGIKDFQIADAVTRGARADANIGLRTKTLQSNQAAELASRGIDIGQGSPLDILASTTFMGARDIETNDLNTDKEVWGLRQEAANYRSNASVLRQRAAMENPGGAAAGVLLGGAGRVASSWYKQSRGAFNPYLDN